MRRSYASCGSFLALTLLWIPAIAWGQGAGGDKPRFDQLGRVAGIGRFAPGDWGVVSAQLVNPTGAPVKLLATTYFDGESHLQYAREVTLPPNTRRTIIYPVRMPEKEKTSPGATFVDLKSMLFDRTGAQPVLLKPPSGQVLHSERVSTTERGQITAMIAPAPTVVDSGEHGVAEEPDMILEALYALRLGAKQSKQVITLRTLPTTAEELDALDHLAISNDRIAEDSAAVSAVRRWVQQGGKLWIALDRVSPSTVEQIFGDAFSCQIVDRIGLNAFEIREPAPSAPNQVSIALDSEVDFVRVIPAGVDVVHEINGWPASFWLSYGRGMVLFTTLAPEGWVRARTSKDARPREQDLFSDFIATDPFAKLAVTMLEPPPPESVSNEQLAAFATEQVGYKIVSRGTVLATLSLFCVALLGVGVWLLKKERTEALGWLGPAGALLTAVVLVGMGTAARQAVPKTVAEIQLIDAPAGTSEASVSGLAAIYTPDPADIPLGSNGGGMVTPDGRGSGGESRRVTWTDLDKWSWENLNVAAGVSTAKFQTVIPLKERMQIRGTFGPDGFVGKLQAGSLKGFEDALVVTSLNRRLAATVDADGTVTAKSGGVLARSEYLTTTFLNDEQQRRLAVLKQLLSGGKYAKYGASPSLLAWTSPIDLNFIYPPDSKRTGSALAAIPIEIERPAPGTEIVIPSPFIASRDVAGPTALPGSRQTYNFRDGTWSERPEPARTWLRFELPSEVLPIKLTSVQLNLQVSAPSRTLEIEGFSGPDQVVPLAKQSNPMGTFSFKIDRPEVLEVDGNGNITFGLNIFDSAPVNKDPRNGGGENFWKMEYVDLEVRGQTAAP